ncbi:hypothetical protein [Neobacillus niacini]|uniref:hypothetical protein n=1 Tax=Neobacillus niacini TaxID=86668 RepID=UPI002FFE8EF8
MYVNRLVEKRLGDAKKHAAMTKSEVEYHEKHLLELKVELSELENEITELENYLK